MDLAQEMEVKMRREVLQERLKKTYLQVDDLKKTLFLVVFISVLCI